MKIGNTYARLNKYLDRGKAFMGTFQMPITIITALGVFKETTLGIWIFSNSTITIPLIVICFYALLIFVGWIEYRFGLIQKQIEIDNNNNQVLQELLKRERAKQ